MVLQEYVDAVRAVPARTSGLEAKTHQALETRTLGPTVEALMSLHGVATITAMTVLAELGDLTHFDSPRLMGFVVLAPVSGGDHQDR